jgi:ribose-phosphate pyrophosphokinase
MNNREPLQIDWRFEAEREILDLFSLRELLPTLPMALHVPYLPYARQDKAVGNHLSFNLQVFGDLVNQLGFTEVTAVDVHNPVRTHELITKFRNIEVDRIHRELIEDIQPDFIVFPDLGARNRYPQIRYDKRLIFYKVRDQATGKITGHDFSYRDSYGITLQGKSDATLSEVIEDGDSFLIIDDLCDGGATFISIAEKLHALKKDLDINLFVTHGLFSKGRKVLIDAGIKLFTTNSLLRNADGFEV